MSWRIMGLEAPEPFRISNPKTGEIRERPTFSTLVEDHDWYADICGRIAETLGPDVLKRWQDGDESLDLAAEVRALRERLAAAEGTVAGCRRALAEALNSGDGGYRP